MERYYYTLLPGVQTLTLDRMGEAGGVRKGNIKKIPFFITHEGKGG